MALRKLGSVKDQWSLELELELPNTYLWKYPALKIYEWFIAYMQRPIHDAPLRV
jgi:hypothetical protein